MRPTISTIELRAHPRYVADPLIGAAFGDLPVVLVNISVAGALIRHEQAIVPQTERALRLRDQLAVADLHGEIIWTRANPRAPASFESGVKFVQWIEVAQAVIDRLIERRAIRLDTSRPPSRISEDHS